MSFFPRVPERRSWLQGRWSGASAALGSVFALIAFAGVSIALIACASVTQGEPASAKSGVPVRPVTAPAEPAAATPSVAPVPLTPAAHAAPPAPATQSSPAAQSAPVTPTQNGEATAASLNAPLPDLNVAAYEGRIADVRKLLAAGAAIDARDNQGGSALMAALRKYSSESKTTATSARRTDPTTDPRAKRKLQIALLLIDRGASVTLANALGFTALHYAASFAGDDKAVTEVIDHLLAHGAAINQATDPTYARTPLELALDQPDSGRVARLLERGANPKQTTYEGKSLPEVAEQNGYPASAALLRAALAK